MFNLAGQGRACWCVLCLQSLHIPRQIDKIIPWSSGPGSHDATSGLPGSCKGLTTWTWVYKGIANPLEHFSYLIFYVTLCNVYTEKYFSCNYYTTFNELYIDLYDEWKSCICDANAKYPYISYRSITAFLNFCWCKKDHCTYTRTTTVIHFRSQECRPRGPKESARLLDNR